MTPAITKSPIRAETALEPAFFYNSAREGMRDFLDRVVGTASGGVLLPGFIGWSAREGSGVLDPVKQSGVPFDFYALNDDLSVDLSDIERRLSVGTFQVLVVIHYFGRTDPELAAVRKIADSHGVLLVEDLAHGFFSSAGAGAAGRFGDVKLFSLHKQFPFVGGGLVVYSDLSLVRGQASTRPELAARVMSYNWRRIADARRRNFATLTRSLTALPGHGRDFILFWPDLDEHDVPQSLPVLVNGAERSDIYSSMNQEGFGMVSLYHTLIPEIGEEFPSLTEVSRHIINFPIHQDVDSGYLQSMVESFGRHVGIPVDS